jgi:hypothetical protein
MTEPASVHTVVDALSQTMEQWEHAHDHVRTLNHLFGGEA